MNNYSLSNFRQLPASEVSQLKLLSFSATDVLTHPEDIRVRRTNLDKALSLNSSELLSTAIILKSADGKLYKLDAKVTSFDGHQINTNKGIAIPLVCIYSIDFY